VLNPADPPLIMRDTIFCQLPQGNDEILVSKAIEDAVARVALYVPGYRLKAPPQFATTANGTPRVAVFVEVEGAGDSFPPYAGNLDIMTAAAAAVGERLAQHLAKSSHSSSSSSSPSIGAH
jgi:acetaldehyde dehydrogenase